MSNLGDLVATLAVNNAPWKAGLKQSQGQMSSFASSISRTVAPLAGIIGGVWGAKASVSAYSESLQAARKLQAVLTATGGAAGLTGQQIAEYAAELQKVTNFEDDATVAAAAMLASFTNIRGDVFKDAIAGAQDMTAIMGGDLEGNVRLLGKALNDPIDGLSRLARAGVQFNESEIQQITLMQKAGNLLGAQGIILDKVGAKFGGAAKATADPMKQLQNTVGDVAENVGSLLLPALNVGAEALSSLFSVVVGGGDSFKTLGIEAAVQLSHIGSYLVLAATQGELFGVQLGESIGHFFTEAVPRYLEWFQDNWQNIFVTVASNTLTIFENLGTNIGDAMTKIWAFIKSGGTADLQLSWKPLTDGFINTIKELPDIPDRVATDFEKSLLQSIEGQSETIATSMAEQRAKIEKQFSPLNAPASLVPPPEVDDLSKDKGAKAAAKTVNTAALAGSSEAFSIMLRGVGGTPKAETLLAKGNAIAAEQLAITKTNKPQQLQVANIV